MNNGIVGPSATTSRKRNFLQRSLEHLDVLITDGYALSVTEIKDLMMTIDDTDNIHIYNNEVKIFLYEQYGDKIKFSKSNRVNQSELVYSSDIDADTLATKLRSLDVVRSSGEIMWQALRNVDFKLQDKFCDGTELKDSWEKTRIVFQHKKVQNVKNRDDRNDRWWWRRR